MGPVNGGYDFGVALRKGGRSIGLCEHTDFTVDLPELRRLTTIDSQANNWIQETCHY